MGILFRPEGERGARSPGLPTRKIVRGRFWPKGLSGKMWREHDLPADHYIPHMLLPPAHHAADVGQANLTYVYESLKK